MTIKSPCKDCEERVLGCHSNCKKYLKFKKDTQEEKDKIIAGKLAEQQQRSYLSYQSERRRRRSAKTRKVGS